jgi:hypothetical protein
VAQLFLRALGFPSSLQPLTEHLIRRGLLRKHSLKQLLYYCVCTRCRDVYTDSYRATVRRIDRHTSRRANSKPPPILFQSKEKETKKLNSIVWARRRTIPTERPPLVGEVIANILRIEGATWSAWRIPTAVFSNFIDRSRYFSIK